jgi:hypothetical protein
VVGVRIGDHRGNRGFSRPEQAADDVFSFLDQACDPEEMHCSTGVGISDEFSVKINK